MNTRVIFGFSASVVCATVAQAEGRLKALEKPIPAPALHLTDLEDRLWRTEDLKGQPTIVNFWATWCVPCRQEIPSMENAYQALKGEGIQMLAISVAEEADAVERFEVDYPMSFPVLPDPEGTAGQHWPVRGLPTTFVVNAEGMIVYSVVGPREWDDAELLAQIRELKP